METCEIEINDLPIEIIMKILGFLKGSALQQAILTCKLWKIIIETTRPWSLIVTNADDYNKNNPQYNFLVTTERKISSIELREVDCLTEESVVIDTVRRHGKNLIKLCLIDLWLGDWGALVQVLNHLPNLRELNIFKTNPFMVASSNLVENELPELPKLETLQISVTHQLEDYLKCLKKVKVKAFKMVDFSHDNTFQCDVLKDFLKTQDKLTTLALRSAYEPMMLTWTTNLNASMQFQLTRLSLLYQELAEEHYRNLINFLENHSQSLKELQLGLQFHHRIYECVLAKMTNLETLDLVMDDIQKYSKILGRWKKNLSIKNLIVKKVPQDTVETRQFFGEFFKCLPNVTDLAILGDRCPKAVMKVASENLSQLTVLWVSEYSTEFCGLHFPNLNALHIEILKGKVNWEIFSKAHPRLTEFTLEMFDGVDNSDESTNVSAEHENNLNLEEIEKMTKANVHLHALRFGKWFKADTRSLEVLRVNCPQLRALQLHKNCAVLNEPYDQSWAGVIRFSGNSFQSCHLQTAFWSEDDFFKKQGRCLMHMK